MTESVEQLLERAHNEVEDSVSTTGSAAVSAAREVHIAGTTALLQDSLDEQRRTNAMLAQVIQLLARQTVLLEGVSESAHSTPSTLLVSPPHFYHQLE
jgi:hypothetical protein